MKCHRLLLAALVLAAALSGPAAAQNWTQLGTLSCRVDPNIGFIIVGHQPMNCVFNPSPGLQPQVPVQSYDGAINTVGISIGISAGSVLGIGLGAGANVLIGGSNRTIALQPLSLQGSVALNVVAGLSSLKLRWH